MSIEARLNEELIDAWANIVATQEALTRERYEIEQELMRRMAADGATILDHPRYDVTLTAKIEYDRGKLHPLRELVPPEVVAKGYTPEHEETVVVPERWNMTKVKTWAKYGKAAQEIIEAAAFKSAPRLSIKAKGTTA